MLKLSVRHEKADRCGDVTAPFREEPVWRGILPALLVAGAMLSPLPAFAEEKSIEDYIQGNGADPGKDIGVPQLKLHAPDQILAAPQPEGQTAWPDVLQRMMVTGERRELMASLGDLLRQGDVSGAKQLVSAAVKTGTLAIYIADHIDDTALQASLKAIADEKQAAPTPPPVADAPTADEGPSADLEREKSRADAAIHELNALKEQLALLKTERDRAAELEQALASEKERAAVAARELSAMQEKLEKAANSEAAAAEFRDEASREKERANAASRELTTAHEQLAGLRLTAVATTELKNALEQERKRSAVLDREVEALNAELTGLRATAAEAANAMNSADEERKRADAALRQVGVLQEQLSASKAEEARLRDAMTAERKKAAAALEKLNQMKVQAQKPDDRDDRRVQDDKDVRASRGTVRKVSLPREAEASADPSSEPNKAQARRKPQPPQADDIKTAKPVAPKPRQADAPDRKRSTALRQTAPRAPSYDVMPDATVLDLPDVLLPDTRFWQIE